MKRLFYFSVFVLPLAISQSLSAQTVNISYLNPSFGDGVQYNFSRFGNSSEFYAGFMHNISSSSYGNGDDFTIFTYDNRDIVFRAGTGNLNVYPGTKVGIGTLNPTYELDVKGTIAVDNLVRVQKDGSYRIALSAAADGYVSGRNASLETKFLVTSNGTSYFNGGNMGIGTTNTLGFKLAVNGHLRAKEITVDTGWADFVFQNDYSLPTLSDVEAHIKEKGHLQDIPSAKEVEENGIKLGAMNAKLLQKIEELMLYTIQQQKEIDALKKELSNINSND